MFTCILYMGITRSIVSDCNLSAVFHNYCCGFLVAAFLVPLSHYLDVQHLNQSLHLVQVFAVNCTSGGRGANRVVLL